MSSAVGCARGSRPANPHAVTGRRNPDPLEVIRACVREMADADPDAREAEVARDKEEAARLEEAARRLPNWPRFDAGSSVVKSLEPTEIEPIFQVPESWRIPADQPGNQPPTTTRYKRLGRAYPAATVAEIIRRVRLERPSRALRDQLYRGPAAVPGATSTLIDHVLAQMGNKRLTATRRKRWDRAARRMLDDGSVTLAELEERLK